MRRWTWLGGLAVAVAFAALPAAPNGARAAEPSGAESKQAGKPEDNAKDTRGRHGFLE